LKTRGDYINVIFLTSLTNRQFLCYVVHVLRECQFHKVCASAACINNCISACIYATAE